MFIIEMYVRKQAYNQWYSKFRNWFPSSSVPLKFAALMNAFQEQVLSLCVTSHFDAQIRKCGRGQSVTTPLQCRTVYCMTFGL